MAPERLSASQARRLAIAATGLASARTFGRGRQAVLRAMQQIGYAQIDTISVVQRAHHHTIAARVPGYREDYLFRHLDTHRTIFEYWFHAAAFLPMTDFRFYLPVMEAFRKKPDRWFDEDRRLAKRILDRINAEGPLRAKDFEDSAPQRPGKKDGWWNWKPEKKALERLFFDGRLVVSAREGFQKLYDLPERVIPAHVDTTMPGETELWDWRLKRALSGLGLASEKELRYLRKGWTQGIRDALDRGLESGSIRAVETAKNQGIRYALSDSLQGLPRVAKRAIILSPFDNLLIQRDRTLDLFGFDYQIECYVPAAKRRFGYFVLPILYGDSFAGRMDAKADRKSRRMLIRDLYFETEWASRLRTEAGQRFLDSLRSALEEFSLRNGCDTWSLDRIHLRDAKPVREAICPA